MADYLEYVYDFFYSSIYSIFNELFQNKTLVWFILLPVISTCILLVVDFIFDISDMGLGRLNLKNHRQRDYSYNFNKKYKGYLTADVGNKFGKKYGKDYKNHRIELEKLNKDTHNFKKSDKYPIPVLSAYHGKSSQRRYKHHNANIDIEVDE